MPKKKNKKTSKVEAAGAETISEAPVANSALAAMVAMTPQETKLDTVKPDAADAASKKKMAEIYQAFQGLKLKEEKKKPHQFWNTQPVAQLEGVDMKVEMANEEIETKTVEDVRATPYSLPKSFEWSSVDMNNEETVDEVYNLLCENYVEDDDNMFRFDYSREFLKWALKPPGFKQTLHVGVRVTTGKKKLVGFITGIPAEMAVYHKKTDMVEINFLCVHKKLRSKRLAPVLIKEITRRVNLGGVWQAVYTAGVVLPKPVAQNRYYHRSLNPKKLIEIGFSRLQNRMTLARTQKLYKLPTEPLTVGIRPLETKDIPAACKLLGDYLDKFELHQRFNEAEFAHWFMPRTNVVNSFVVEDPVTGAITDLCSFYTLPSTVIGHEKHNTLKAAYSFYNVAGKTSWKDLMTDALILAKQLEFDVFNALNVMENDDFLTHLKFGIGDGHLQYYLYNWRCKEMTPSEVGLVLL